VNELELTGRARTHLTEPPGVHCLVHRDAAEAFLAMRAAAARVGIDLEAASAFRDFERQRQLWNAKFRGERPLLDAQGRPLDVTRLEEPQRIEAILLWTALPGASRHHWGTDLDVIDRAAVPTGYEVQLAADEYAPGAMFGRLGAWLEANMRHFGFFRPYASGKGGVRPEPWHLSFAPVARRALAAHEVTTLADALQGQEVLGLAAVLARLAQIHERYVRTIDAAPRMRSRWARLPAVVRPS
jgi:LAS superfamily LD-carboxypeptidase LdcB